MSDLEFFKREAKNFLKDWRTQKITQNNDGSISYHYDWKFYDVDYHFTKLKLNDKDRQEIQLARSQHWLSQMLGQKNWTVLISLPDSELDKVEKLLREIKSKGKATNEVQNIQFVPCFRIRCQSEMTFKDKENFGKAFYKITSKIIESIKDTEFWNDHFDFWDTMDRKENYYTYFERRKYLKKKLKNLKIGYVQMLKKAYDKFRDGRTYIGCYCPVVITELIGQLGIRVYKANFGTDKISGFCTNFLEQRNGAEIDEPVIVINEVYCNTPERYLKEVAKQLYYMIAKPDEFDFHEKDGIRCEMRSTQNEANFFAQDLFISVEYINAWLKRFGEQGEIFYPNLTRDKKEFFLQNYNIEHIVNRIKGDFFVDYRTVIRLLLKSDWQYKIMFDSYEEADAFYLECLKRHDEKYDEPIKWTKDEPEALPWEYTDFIARKQYIL